MAVAARQGLSLNFGFLAEHSPELEELAAQSERLCYEDPNAALFRLRQFVEGLAAEVARRTSCHWVFREDFFNRLVRLEEAGLLNADVARLFHEIRKTGNRAVHYGEGTAREALYHLKMARNLAVWYHRVFARQPRFLPEPFEPPVPGEEGALDEATRQELRHLRSRIENLEDHLRRARETANRQREARREAETWAKQARADLEKALQVMEESGNENAGLLLRQHLTGAPGAALAVQEDMAHYQTRLDGVVGDRWRERCAEAAELMGAGFDEDDLRYLIDIELRGAGWEADGLLLRWDRGARPALDHPARAIAQWPTYEGPASYLLFHKQTPLAPVLVDPGPGDLREVIERAKRLSRDYVISDDQSPPATQPWGGPGGFRLPFALATNGRAFAHRQSTGRGLWLADLRSAAPRVEPLKKWPKAQDLRSRLG